MRKHFTFTGRVQGVGFRWRASAIGEMLGLTGWVQNRPDGAVEMEAEGPEEAIDRLLQMLQNDRYIDITGIRAKTLPEEGGYRFEIRDDLY